MRTASIGAIALAPSNPNVVWVGTGEGNPRNDVVDGGGVFMSPDAGKTWQLMGLRDVGQITRIVIDPTNSDVVLVAAAELLHRGEAGVAPIRRDGEVAVVPLSKKEELIRVAQDVVKGLRGEFRVEYDQTGGNIGRRYRRQDEIGTPFCITVDFDTLNDRAVTIRQRDSTQQERVAIAGLTDRLVALTSPAG